MSGFLVTAALVVAIWVFIRWAMDRPPNLRFALLTAWTVFILWPSGRSPATWFAFFMGAFWLTELVRWARLTDKDRLYVGLLAFITDVPYSSISLTRHRDRKS